MARDKRLWGYLAAAMLTAATALITYDLGYSRTYAKNSAWMIETGNDCDAYRRGEWNGRKAAMIEATGPAKAERFRRQVEHEYWAAAFMHWTYAWRSPAAWKAERVCSAEYAALWRWTRDGRKPEGAAEACRLAKVLTQKRKCEAGQPGWGNIYRFGAQPPMPTFFKEQPPALIVQSAGRSGAGQ